MNLKRDVLCLLVASLVFGLSAGAEPLPPGEYQYDFPCEEGLWDMSGFSEYCEADQDVEVCLDLIMSQDGKGKFVGTGTGYTYFMGVDFDFDAELTGSVKSSGDQRIIDLKVNLDGVADYSGERFYFAGNSRFLGEFDCATGMAYGTVKAKGCVKGYGCASGAGEGMFEPPGGMNGSWSLTIEVAGDQVVSGTIRLSNAELLALMGKAKYSSKTDATVLALKGAKLSPISNGSKLKAAIDGGDFGLEGLSGKALGQKVQ